MDQTAQAASAARKLAIKLLGRREHSRRELQVKLARKGYEGSVVTALLQELVDADWQSEQRFTEAFARERLQRGRGPIRTRAELRERGIDDTLIDTVLNDETDWVAVLGDIAKRRFGPDSPADGQESAKRKRFLYNRGFSSADIHRFFRDAGWEGS